MRYQSAFACFHALPSAACRAKQPRQYGALGKVCEGVAAAEEAEACMIKVVVVPLINDRLRGARGEKRINPAILEEHADDAHRLVAEVSAHYAARRARGVRLPDFREEQQARVRHRECGEHHHVGGLNVFRARVAVDITHGSRALCLAVVIVRSRSSETISKSASSGERYSSTSHLGFFVRLADDALEVAADWHARRMRRLG